MTRMTRFAVALVATAGGLLATRAARAQDAGTNPTCASLPNPVYLTGSSAFEPTVASFAVKLAAASTPMTVVYAKPGSCAGVLSIASKADLTGTATYYSLTGTTLNKLTCTLPSSGTKADIGVSDVFYGSCGTVVPAQPTDLKDFPGPVQAMEFVVPKANTTTKYLTAAEAQDIWGCGAGASVAGFTQAGGIFCRNADSGTQIVVADNIGLQPTIPAPPICVSESNSTNMYTAIEGFSMPQASIGFLGADVYDKQAANLNALAFQAVGQSKAYYADSAPGAADRQNVRDGHYPMWGYEHMFAYVGTGGTPSSANAAKLIGLILGTVTDPTFDYVQVEGKSGTIPVCAMKVKKGDDLPGYLSAADGSAGDCSCAYVAAATGTAPSSCTACTTGDGGTSGGCTGGKTCQHGYCQ